MKGEDQRAPQRQGTVDSDADLVRVAPRKLQRRRNLAAFESFP